MGADVGSGEVVDCLAILLPGRKRRHKIANQVLPDGGHICAGEGLYFFFGFTVEKHRRWVNSIVISVLQFPIRTQGKPDSR